MSLFEIYAEIIKSPTSLKLYKDLVQSYQRDQKSDETSAFSMLIEKKFDKNANNTDIN